MTVVRARGRRGAQAGWRSEPCPASLPAGILVFDCQRPQHYQGTRHRGHASHRWQGELDGKRVTVTWFDESNTDSDHAR